MRLFQTMPVLHACWWLIAHQPRFTFFAVRMVHAHQGVMAWEVGLCGKEVLLPVQVLACTEV